MWLQEYRFLTPKNFRNSGESELLLRNGIFGGSNLLENNKLDGINRTETVLLVTASVSTRLLHIVATNVGRILRLFSDFHRQTRKVCHKLAKIKSKKKTKKKKKFPLWNFPESSLSLSAHAKELTDGERGPKWFDQLLPHLFILSERSAGIIICHMLWHGGITLFVTACRAAATVERSGEKIPRGGEVGGGVSTGVGTLCILNAAPPWRAARRRCYFNIWCILRGPLRDDQRWGQPWNVSLDLTRGGYQWWEVGWDEDVAAAVAGRIVTSQVKRRGGLTISAANWSGEVFWLSACELPRTHGAWWWGVLCVGPNFKGLLSLLMCLRDTSFLQAPMVKLKVQASLSSLPCFKWGLSAHADGMNL